MVLRLVLAGEVEECRQVDHARDPCAVLALDPLDRCGNRGVIGQVGPDQREGRLAAAAVEPDYAVALRQRASKRAAYVAGRTGDDDQRLAFVSLVGAAHHPARLLQFDKDLPGLSLAHYGRMLPLRREHQHRAGAIRELHAPLRALLDQRFSRPHLRERAAVCPGVHAPVAPDPRTTATAPRDRTIMMRQKFIQPVRLELTENHACKSGTPGRHDQWLRVSEPE